MSHDSTFSFRYLTFAFRTLFCVYCGTILVCRHITFYHAIQNLHKGKWKNMKQEFLTGVIAVEKKQDIIHKLEVKKFPVGRSQKNCLHSV